MRTSMRALVLSLVTAAALLGVANAAVARAARNSMPRQALRAVSQVRARVHVLAMGNSLMAAGFDTAAFAAASRGTGTAPVVINGALGASDIIEHLALAEQAWRATGRIDTLVYGFFDHQLWTPVPIRTTDLIGNHTLLYLTDPRYVRELGAMSWRDRLLYEAYRPIALLRERSAIWARVEHLRRRLGTIGMPVAATNAFGRRDDFSALEAAGREAFERRNQQVLSPAVRFAPAIDALFRAARLHGTTLIVVEMPMSPSHRERFYEAGSWPAVREKTRRAVAKAGGCYIDASAWVPDGSRFDDNLHMGRAGAREFSTRLADVLNAARGGCP